MARGLRYGGVIEHGRPMLRMNLPEQAWTVRSPTIEPSARSGVAHVALSFDARPHGGFPDLLADGRASCFLYVQEEHERALRWQVGGGGPEREHRCSAVCTKNRCELHRAYRIGRSIPAIMK